MRWSFCFLAPFFLLLLAAVGLLEPGTWQNYLLFLIYFPLLIPLDTLLGPATADLSPDDPVVRRQRWAFRIVPWLWAPLGMGLLGWSLWVVARREPDAAQFLGIMLTAGFINGTIGFIMAHELMHRPTLGERWLGALYLLLASYPHFAVEHVYNHHRNVATPEDPATARYGESLYRFLPRLWLGEIAGATRHEQQRLKKRGYSRYSWRSRRVRRLVALLALYGAIAAWAGWLGLLFMVGQSIVAIVLLAIVNYIQHYGLLRRRLPAGGYEPVTFQHSWNSSHIISSALLLNLGRHADHHLRPGRPYHLLRHHADGLHLPYGFLLMTLMAVVPPLFFRVMNPRVERLQQVALALSPQPA